MATQLQIQRYANERVRVRCEQLRDLVESMRDDKASIDDIYATLNADANAFSDDRVDGPPNLLTGADVLAYNTIITDLVAWFDAHAQKPIVLKACVRPVLG